MNNRKFPCMRSVRACTQVAMALFFTAVALGQGADQLPFSLRTRQEIEAIQQDKVARSPAERKLDSQLVYALREQQRKSAVPGISMKSSVRPKADGRLLIDLRATVSPTLLSAIQAGGGTVVSSVPRYQAVRAFASLELCLQLASRPDVRNVRPADEATTHTGPVNSQGDVTHRADVIRNQFAVTGAGIKVGAMSDSVDFLGDSQAAGELPVVQIVPGQAGFGRGEGTAMLEIIHDLAPGAELHFATALGGVAVFAENIRKLHEAGCRIIVDDISYFSESPFQDGPIARAVNEVCTNGTLYFSSAGNWGNKNDSTSSVWEGDFVDGGESTYGRGGRFHDFGGTNFNLILGGNTLNRIDLFWADPLGASTNDYDVYLINPDGSVAASSSNVQDGDDDPYENIIVAFPNQRIAIVKYSGEARYLHVSNGRSRLQISTAGSVRGHNAVGASNAFSVAATWVRVPAIPFTGGITNPVELFNGDGPRRIFFHPDGSPITPGNFTSTGGEALAKPDITAADGVTTSVPGFNPFFGTSAAAPHAAAIAALLWSATPIRSPQEIREALISTALDIEQPGVDFDSGVGIIMVPPAFEITSVGHPRVIFHSIFLQDASTNGTFEINECADLFVVLDNRVPTNGTTAFDVQAFLRSNTSGVLVDPSPRFFGDMPAGARLTNALPFRISTTPDFICNTPVVLELIIISSNGLPSLIPLVFQPTPFEQGIPQSFESTNAPLDVPDLASIESSILITNVSQPLVNVSVAVHLTHSFDSDLHLSLIGPDGTTINLSSDNGGSGTNYGLSCSARTVFTDNASNSITAGAAPLVGSFRPEEPLAAYFNKIGNGIWRLRVTDVGPADVGTLQCWSLELTPISCPEGSGGCLFPPSIVIQPQNITATNGFPAQLSVSAQGTELHYQWFFGSNALHNGTNADLVFTNVTATNAGTYFVVITNAFGAVTSELAVVTVVAPPLIVQPKVDYILTNGMTASFSVIVEGTPPFTYQWLFETNPIANATNATLVLSNVVFTQSGHYVVRVENNYGFMVSTVALLTVVSPPIITLQPQNQSVLENATVMFGITAIGTEPLAYQWYFNETNALAHETNAVLTLAGVTTNQSGGYSVFVTNDFGEVSSIEAELHVLQSNALPVVVLTQPTNGSNFSVHQVPITIDANANDPDGVVSQLDLFIDGVRIFRTTNSTLQFPWLDPATGPASLVAMATDNQGARGTSAVVQINVDFTTNAVLLIPTNAVWSYLDTGIDQGTMWRGIHFNDVTWSNGPAQLGYGDNDEATVVSFGPEETNKFTTTYFRRSFFLTDAGSFSNLSLRLQRDDGAVVYLNDVEVFRSNMPTGAIGFATQAVTAIAGSAENAFVGTNVSPALLLNGTNTVAVEVHQSNPTSTDLSFSLELRGVRSFAPHIVLQPQNLTVAEFAEASFSVTAAGGKPLSYQWFFNNTNLLAGATNSSLLLLNATRDDRGSYSVVVSNSFGYIQSTAVVLDVLFSNVYPQVSLVAPTNGSVFELNEVVLMDASALDADGSIALIEFLANGVKLAERATPPYQFAWSDAPSGLHSLAVVALDNEGARVTSALSQVTVNFSTNLARLVGAGAIWKYLDTGVNLSNAWHSPLFDDSTWSSGPAELGYGDDDEATVIGFGPEPTNRFITTYFRRAFVLTDPASFTNLFLRLLRDDGAVVYLNGAEVFRSNMPTGAITFSTRALVAVANNAETQFVSQALSPALLQSGTNLLAVEVHQVNPTSTDVSFDLELTAERISPPVILVQPQNRSVSTNVSVLFAVHAVGTAPLAYQWFFNETNVLVDATNAQLVLPPVSLEHAGTYFVIVSNTFGMVTSQVAQLIVSETNLPPLIAIASPTNGAVVPGHLPLVLDAAAADPDGNIARVEFFGDGIPLGEITQAPFQLEWPAVLPGTHEVWAIATDEPGARSTSAVVQVVVAFPTNATQLITRGAAWQYRDTGSDEGVAWRMPDFNAQSWSTGLAELGYGDASEGRPEATVVGFGSDSENKYITTYFRRPFVLTDVSTITELSVHLMRDDGAVVYLNGAEVFRSNMPTGAIAFNTLAADSVAGSAESALFTNIFSPSLLQLGTNVLAIEIHQSSGDSTDISFDLELLASRGLAPIIVTQPHSQTVLAGNTALFSVLSVGTAPLTYQWFFNDTNILFDATNQTLVLTNVSPILAGNYSVLVSNPFGSVLSAPATLTLTDSNPPPIVSIIQPANGQLLNAGSPIAVEVAATDPGGLVTNVEFFADGILIGSDTTAPYQFAWAGVPAGIHTLWAAAQDDLGTISISAVVHVLVNTPAPLPQALVSTGAVWRFWDRGIDLSNAWHAVDYDDSDWDNGPAELGYGDDDEATEISFGPNPSMKHPTYYFRRSFVATNVAVLSQLDLRVRRDDGAVVYLNNIEVFRSNMPEGPIDFTTFAASVVSTGAETNFFGTNVPSELLVDGTNVIAVEIHQNNNISSDVSFDLSLVGREFSSPVILLQPLSQTVTNGDPVQFSVVVTGAPPVSIQWFANFTNALPNETNATLVLGNATTNLIGTYMAAISNAGGLVFSYPASLDVIVPQPNQLPSVSISSPADEAVFFPGGIISIAANATDPDGIITRVEFFADGASLAVVTNAPFVFDWINAALGEHDLHVIATDNRGGASTSAVVNILVANVQAPPATEFTLIQTGAVWKYLDNGVDQGTNWIALDFNDILWSSGPAELGYGDASEGRPEATVLSFGPVETNKHITYYFRHTFQLTNAAAFSEAHLRVLRDDGVVVYLNGTEVFRDNLPAGPVTYDTLALLGLAKTDETIYLGTNVSPLLLLEGTNVVAVEIHQVNAPSSDISFDLELRAIQPISPVIVVQPQDQLAGLGQSARFSVRAVGTEPLTYQWFFNTFVELPGATNDTIVLTNIQPSQEGSYSVVIANQVGSVTSDSALLIIPVAPQVVTGPQNVTVAEGGTAQFTVVAVGFEPLTYRWLFNGTNDVLNGTNATLVLSNVVFAQSGAYSAVVSNFAGTTVSSASALRVLIGTEITELERVGSDLRIEFLTAAGLRYTVEFADSLVAVQWTGVPGAIKLLGTGDPISVILPNANDEVRFFRIRVE